LDVPKMPHPRTETLPAGAGLPGAMDAVIQVLHETLILIQHRAATGSSNGAIQRDLRVLLECQLKDRGERTQLLLETALLLRGTLKSNGGAPPQPNSTQRAFGGAPCRRLKSKKQLAYAD